MKAERYLSEQWVRNNKGIEQVAFKALTTIRVVIIRMGEGNDIATHECFQRKSSILIDKSTNLLCTQIIVSLHFIIISGKRN